MDIEEVVKAIVFGNIEEGELVDDDMFMGGKKFIFGDCMVSVGCITTYQNKEDEYCHYSDLPSPMAYEEINEPLNQNKDEKN